MKVMLMVKIWMLSTRQTHVFSHVQIRERNLGDDLPKDIFRSFLILTNKCTFILMITGKREIWK